MSQPDARPVRMCDSCGGVDDHPRHVHGVGPGESPTSDESADKALGAATDKNRASIIKQIRDTTTQVKHMDCCAMDGCPDGSCVKVHDASPAARGEYLTGAPLIKHLTSGAVDSIGADMNAQRSTEAQVAAESDARVNHPLNDGQE